MADAAILDAPTVPLTADHHWTAAEFYQAASAGAFEDPDRLELVHERLIRLMQGERHANFRARVSRRLRMALDPPLFARDENPLHIASDAEPIPDVMFLYEEEYEDRHLEPKDVALLVEVADSSVDYDTGEKALIYAQADIADYWVVPVNEAAIICHRGPMPEGYREVTRRMGDDILSPLAAPEVVWTVRMLLGREE